MNSRASFITEKFIENLAAKMPAGEALQQAKLAYLQQADGRMKSPVYWAGIVLMGDAGTVMLSPKSNYEKWLLLYRHCCNPWGNCFFCEEKKKTKSGLTQFHKCRCKASRQHCTLCLLKRFAETH